MTLRYVHWREKDLFVGYLEDYPDYPTQGLTEEELRDNLVDIYRDLVGGLVNNVRRVDTISVPV